MGETKMSDRIGLTALCVAALIVLASCGGSSGGGDTPVIPSAPAAPTGVTAMPGNAQATLSWPAVPGATSYNVYTSSTPPVTNAGTKTNVAATGATLSSLTNGTPVFAAVTAGEPGGGGTPFPRGCAGPPGGPPPRVCPYDALCRSALDRSNRRKPL